jgi:hypothetical protein
LANGMKMWKGNGNITLLFSLIVLWVLHEVNCSGTEVKGVGRRRTQLLDDIRNTRRYWELKEEAEDRKRCKRQFITGT